MNRRYEDVCARLLANSVVDPDRVHPDGTSCWLWLGSRCLNRRGTYYGRLTLRIKGKPRGQKAHRIALREFKGERLRRGLVVAHKCNNTLCINPAHLEQATQRANMRQCVAAGRHNSQREPGEEG